VQAALNPCGRLFFTVCFAEDLILEILFWRISRGGSREFTLLHLQLHATFWRWCNKK
jgi:hypothetical protein